MRPATLVLLLAGAALPAAAQTPDRYGYAPPDAQVPMRPMATAAPGLRTQPTASLAAPQLRGPAMAAPRCGC